MSSLDKLLLDADTNDEFTRNMMSALVRASKEANQLPRGADFKAKAALDPEFAETTAAVRSKTVQILNTLCEFVRPEAPAGSSLREAQRLPDDITDPMLYEQVVDAIDILLSGADSYFDKLEREANRGSSSGGRKSIEEIAQSVGTAALLDKNRVLNRQHSSVTVKPQLAFFSEINNFRSAPFQPRLPMKYHALPGQELDLQLRIKPRVDDQFELTAGRYIAGSDGQDDELLMSAEECALMGADWRRGAVGPDQYYPHPYEKELQELPLPQWCQQQPAPVDRRQVPAPGGDAPTVVENEQQLQSMMERLALQLKKQPELAVDLEHHSLRTFQGLTCLMQLSTRFEDFIIDTLALRQSLHQLGLFFADPTIVKVLHGCEKDILWLQRDLGLYVVNCFDTHIAAKVLQLPALSLAHLLRVYCGGLIVDKKHQLSDWRQRPLPEEMRRYARDDTHYLLHIYDVMRCEVWEKAQGKEGLEKVFFGSLRLCLQRYEKPLFYPQGYSRLLAPSRGRLQQQGQPQQQSSYRRSAKEKYRPSIDDIGDVQDAALAALWDWRDAKARELDESCDYLMPNAALLRIGMMLPRTAQQIRDECSPVTEFMDEQADAICSLLQQAVNPGGSTMQAAIPEIIVVSTGSSNGSGSGSFAGAQTTTPSKTESLSSSLFTFTPAVPQMSAYSHSPSPTTPSFQQAPRSNSNVNLPINSPLLSTEYVFENAKWKSPESSSSSSSSGSGSDAAIQRLAVQQEVSFAAAPISDANKQRMQQSEEEYQRKQQESGQGLLGRLYRIVSGSSPAAAPAGAGSAANATTAAAGILLPLVGDQRKGDLIAAATVPHDVDEELHSGSSDSDDEGEDSIPETMADITRKSQRTKRKNKDKKRAGAAVGDSIEVDDSMASFDSSHVVDVTSSLRDSYSSGITSVPTSSLADLYFTAPHDAIDNSVDGTLDFAQSIGWLRSAEDREAVKAQYEKDVLNQQMPENDAANSQQQQQQQSSGVGGNHAALSSGAQRGSGQSHDNQSVGSTSAGGSRAVNREGGVPRSKKSSGKAPPHHVQPFDYSALNLGGTISIGALPQSIQQHQQQQQHHQHHGHSSHGRDSQGSSSGRGGGKNKNSGARNNPYMFGGNNR